MQESEIIEILKNRLDKKRVQHILAVADTAEKIVRNISKESLFKKNVELNIDKNSQVKKVRLAALLHDFAKNLPPGELYSISKLIADEWMIDDEELAIPQVLHAPVSAYLAKNEIGINDYEILEAIRYHTIGSPEMGEIAQVIFVSDFIEPNRDFYQARETRYELSNKGLEYSIIMICDFNIKYNIEWRRQLHPNTVLLRNAYLRRQN